VAEATVTADLSITARMEGAIPVGTAVIDGANALPDLGHLDICLYQANVQKGEVMDKLLTQLRCAYGDAQCCLRVISGEAASEGNDDFSRRLTAAE
jgi:hypothetical protein